MSEIRIKRLHRAAAFAHSRERSGDYLPPPTTALPLGLVSVFTVCSAGHVRAWLLLLDLKSQGGGLPGGHNPFLLESKPDGVDGWSACSGIKRIPNSIGDHWVRSRLFVRGAIA